MNNFEKTFFKKYISEWQEVRWIIHEHWIKIVDNFLLRIGLFTLVPSFLLYNSLYLQWIVNFMYFEIYLIIIYLKLVYDIFNWYNDVWIITDDWVIELNWALFKTSTSSVRYENIEWIWVEQWWIWDKILNKWDIIINKIWDDEFRLVDAKVPYEALNEIERISNEIKNASLEEKEEADRTKFELIIEALWWVVDNYLEEKWVNWNDILRNKKRKYTTPKNNYEEEIVLEEGTIDLR